MCHDLTIPPTTMTLDDGASSLTIRVLDLSSDAELAQLNALEEAHQRHWFGASQHRTAAQVRESYAGNEYWSHRLIVAELENDSGGTIIAGCAELTFPLKENLDTVYLDVCVHPALMGRGIGTALVDQGLAAIAQTGRTKISSWGILGIQEDPDDPQLPISRLAARAGLRRVTTAIIRTASLPLPAETVEALQRECDDAKGNYRILTWRGPVPEEYLDSWVQLMRQLDDDDPNEEWEMDTPEYTGERIREGEKTLAARGIERIVAVAVAPDGTLAGNSYVDVRGEGSSLGAQENTVVMPEHRGHGLGLALKLATHRLVPEEAPHVRTLITYNSHINDHMIRINEKLGYVAVAKEAAYQPASVSGDEAEAA